MKTPPRDEAARALARTDHEADRAVEAGAGTGKTTLLVGRIVHGLNAGAFSMRELVAITFTRKAAGELRDRLRRDLAKAEMRERAARPPDDAGLRAPTDVPIATALRELPLARVSTIHSFCARLLRQHPLEAGLDPDFDVSAETRQREQFEASWARWLHDRRPEAGDPIAEAIAWNASLDTLRDVAFALVSDPDVDPPAPADAPGDEEIWAAVVEEAVRLRDLIVAGLKPGKPDALADALSRFVEAARELETLPATDRVRYLARRVDERSFDKEKRLALTPDGLRSNSGAAKNYRADVDLAGLRAAVAAWRTELAAPLVTARLGGVAVRAARALAEFRDSARDDRIARGVLSQTDLLHEALRLLRDERNGVLDRVCRRTSALMIDEYQDTDPIQSAIVGLIGAHRDAPTLFLVGDPKQSIYRFRRADVETYMEEVGRLQDAGRLGTIRVNFRSRAPLIDAINRVGRECFEATPGGVQAPWEDLEPYPETEEGRGGASVEVVSCRVDQDASRSGDLAASEAAAVAARLQAARGDGYEWREMAVLFAATSRLSILENEFDRAGIPYRQEKSQDFFRRVEIAELSWLATAIADPWDEHACVALLRSRLFGIDDATLLAHREADGRFAAATGGTAGTEPVRRALAEIAAWHAKSLDAPPPAVLEEAIRGRDLMRLLASLQHGSREAANVRKLLDQAAAWWEDGGLGMADFARWLRAQVVGSATREAESPSAEEDDRVSLLTVHAAKGLEWKVVALYDVHAAGGRPGAPVTVHERSAGGRRRLAVRLGALMQTPGYDTARERDDALSGAERVRLLYVAMTRAEERLVIAAPESPLDGRANGALLAILRTSPTWTAWEEAAREGRDPEPPHVSAPAVAPLPTASRPSRRTPDAAARRTAAERREAWRAGRATTLRGSDCIVVTVPSDLHDESVAIDAPPRDVDGRLLGSAVHLALEWLASGRVPDPVDAVARATGRAPDDRLTRAARELVDRAEASETWARMRTAPAGDVMTELPIAWHTTAGALPGACRAVLDARLAESGRPATEPDTPLFLEGFADLVLREGASLTVVDYKTDAYSGASQEEALLRRYAPQLEAYRAALLRVPGIGDVRCVLLALGGPDGARELPLP